jgi:hypothetical protein
MDAPEAATMPADTTDRPALPHMRVRRTVGVYAHGAQRNGQGMICDPLP